MTKAKPMRIAHTMLRVRDLERSLAFYTGPLGMTLFRREDYPDGRFTLAFVGYDTEASGSVIELTHNWGKSDYVVGDAYGHVAVEVRDLAGTCGKLEADGVQLLRAAGPMAFLSSQRKLPESIAFLKDPDGYHIELVQLACTSPSTTVYEDMPC